MALLKQALAQHSARRLVDKVQSAASGPCRSVVGLGFIRDISRYPALHVYACARASIDECRRLDLVWGRNRVSILSEERGGGWLCAGSMAQAGLFLTPHAIFNQENHAA